ncbi:MAG TPA: metallophosphoesterase [Terriglobales bacterium]|nr:metallophosphoesterase [Terriglobales bacterium]
MTSVSKIRRWSAVAAVLLLLPSTAVPLGASERVVAIGDAHGDIEALTGILRDAGLIDANRRWTGGPTTLVQTGDMIDRGPADRAVLDLMMALEKEAPRKKGRVTVLLGNHEIMNMTGDLRYVRSYATFASPDSEKRRRKAFEQYLDWRKDRAPPTASTISGADLEKQWMDAHPPGFLEHREAFAPDGKYGRWLREKPVIARLDGVLFVHGGINPALPDTDPERINKRVRDELQAMDAFRTWLAQEKIALPFFTLQEATEAAQAELDRLKADAATRTAAAQAEGKSWKPSETDDRRRKTLEEFLAYNRWYSIHPDGPVWFRGYAEWTEAEGTPKVAALLASLGATNLVVGHTPQADGRVRVRFGGRVFLIDTGMLTGYLPQGRASALEISSPKFTAVYHDERIVLLNGPVTPVPSRPAAAPGGGSLAEYADAESESAAPAASTEPLPHQWIGPDGQPLPFKSDAELLEFLRTAKVRGIKDIGTGITNPKKMKLVKDGIVANAVYRNVGEEKTYTTMAGGQTEMFFRDDATFEPAAYELSQLLGLPWVPPAIKRGYGGTDGSMQIWLEGVTQYTDIQKKKIEPPDRVRWSKQLHVMRVFDNLVYNTDRNQGNMLIDKHWRLWLIDHTRAFRRQENLRTPDLLVQCDRGFLERLRNLDEGLVREKMKKYLRSAEIDALFVRRRKIIEHFDKLIRERGETMVLFNLEPIDAQR